MARASKKKKKRSRRSEAAVVCGQCAQKVSTSKVLKCVCTRIVFCSEACRDLALGEGGGHACTGPPETRIDLDQKMSDFKGRSWSNATDKERWAEEHRRTVIEPMSGILALVGSRDGPSLKDYVRFADGGNTACAYMAGIQYRHRMLGTFRTGRNGTIVNESVGRAADRDRPSVLDTDELAFQYFSRAATSGHGLAMQSLGDCYENGTGVRKDMRMCREWLWRATLQDSAGAHAMLETKSVLINELIAQSQMLSHSYQHLAPFQAMSLCGPNIGSLIITFYRELEARDFILPAFASTQPTFLVGNRPTNGTTGPIKILGESNLKEVVSHIATLERRGNSVVPRYGRRGVGKEATAQSLAGSAFRSLDSNIFTIPPLPTCDDSPTDTELSEWISRRSGLEVECVHVERGQTPPNTCPRCIDGAVRRLRAVARRGVVLSLQESLPGRGHVAVVRGPDGSLVSESFKAYGRGEAECALATLAIAETPARGCLAHPLFVAQDQNIFWPLIFHHGSIRAALEFVCPHMDWDGILGPISTVPEQLPVIETLGNRYRPGKTIEKCGNDLCLRFDLGGKDKLTCGRCMRRSYCSQKCQKADWAIHKSECKAAAKGKTPTPTPPIPKSPVSNSTSVSLTGLQVNDEVLVHSLVSRPDLNGRHGIIIGASASERFPVQLKGYRTTISVKPENLHKLCVRVKTTRNKIQSFKCSDHSLEVCSVCSLDYSIVNNLFKRLNQGDSLARQEIESISETYFARIGSEFDEHEEIVGVMNKQFPMECQGLETKEKQSMLKMAIDLSDKSLIVASAVAGMSCFSARNCIAARPSVISHIEKLLSMWKQI